jgi:hypothetical protein
MASPGSSLLGIGAIGFGVLLVYSAYTYTEVFGADGVIEQFIKSGGDLSKMKVTVKPHGNSLGTGTFRKYTPSSTTTGGTVKNA